MMTQDPLRAAWRAGWRPQDRSSLREWSRKLVFSGDYARPGPFRVENSRHLEGPLDALSNPAVRMVNVRKAIQTFGSGIGEVFFHWVSDVAPGPFMATFQTDPDATEHFETRIRPTMEANSFSSPAIARLYQYRNLYQFPRFNAYFQGANPASLQRKSIQYEWNDEIWLWKRGLLKEAFERTEAYKARCKIYNASQAGVADDDEDRNWSAGRLHEWGWACPACHHEQPLEMFSHILTEPSRRAGIVWNSDARRADGRWDLARAAASARLVCRSCGRDLPDEPRSWAIVNAAGRYLCTTLDIPIRNSSFRWNALVSGAWGDLVTEFLSAAEIRKQGSTVPLRQFYQKKLVIPWDESMSETPAILRTGEFAMGEPLPEATHTFLVADYQEGRGNDSQHFWVNVRAWRRGGASRLLFYGRLDTDDDIRALQQKLAIDDRNVCIDGGDKLLWIAGICARYGWTILRGDDPEYFKHAVKNSKKPRLRAWSPRKRVDPGRGTKLEGRRFAWCFDWSNPSVKNITWRLRHGHGAPWELPVDLPQAYRDQIDSEVKIRLINKRDGTPTYLWKPLNPNNPNNHAWDDECMQTVCALIAGILSFDLNENQRIDSSARPAPVEKSSAPVPPHDRPTQLELLPTNN